MNKPDSEGGQEELFFGLADGTPEQESVGNASSADGTCSQAHTEKSTKRAGTNTQGWEPGDPTADGVGVGNALHDHTQQHTDTYPTPEQAAEYAAAAERKELQGVGNVPTTAAQQSPELDPVSRAKSLAASVMNRLKAEKRWFGLVALERDQMMREAKEAIPDLIQRQIWVYSELDRMYPPPDAEPQNRYVSVTAPESGLSPESGVVDSGAIQGLGDLPQDWPELAANASLPADVGWVQANRLRVVEERPGRSTLVKLGQALSPAPSWAALGWLETSIRSYAKFVDVVAKVSGQSEDEGAVMRAERHSIEEMRAVLEAMKEAEGVCPSCGRPF